MNESNVKSQGWDWKVVNGKRRQEWLEPCIEAYYYADRWKVLGNRQLLDLGCGIGRHAIFFARNKFKVSAFDISPEALEETQAWAQRESVEVDCRQGDMLNLPYADGSYDAVFCRNVLSHSDTSGVKKIIAEIGRVLRPGGECYLTLVSKESYGFVGTDWPMVDENTKLRMEEGPEYGVPHFYVDYDLIQELFAEFEILQLYQVENFYIDDTNNKKCSSWHYHILIRK